MYSQTRKLYKRESTLVADLARCLRNKKSPWGDLRLGFEFEYGGGIADVFAIRKSGEVIAFEAKLTKWKDAMHQAYRTQSFANRSYVVLPPLTAQIAISHEFEFRRRRVGLCTISQDGGIVTLIDSVEGLPLQPWLADRAVLTAKGKGRDAGRFEAPGDCTSDMLSSRHDART